MPRNGIGVYTLPTGNPVAAGTLIEAAWANSTMADIAAEITNSIDKGGRTTPTADLPMGGFKLTGLGAGTAPGHSVRYEQVAELSYAADGVMATLGTSGPVNVNTRIPQHLLIPSGVVTLTFTNPYASGTVTVWSLILQMGGTAYTVNWPASVKWAGGAAPTLSGINKMDILSFMSYDGGTTWYGQLIGKSFAP